jgi:16S rRNA G966 N2-methylase RsmD
VDNKSNESDWDMDLLAEELPGLDLSAFDFDFGIEGEEETEIVEDEAPEVDEDAEPIAKLGDIWQLGRHRLMCGDSTDKATVEMLMDGKKADMVFTDPPYGISVVQGNKVGGGGVTHFGKVGGENIVQASTYMAIKGDNTTDTARLNYEIVKELSENQIVFGGNYFTDFLPPKACWCIWDKENTGNFADVEMAWTSFDKGAKLYRWLWNGLCRKGERSVEGKSRVHPTQKPVGLIAEILKDFTKEDDIVLDCFGGSGSTLIACEQIDRTCYMIEYEAHYVDVIIKRWETLTGEKAVLVND